MTSQRRVEILVGAGALVAAALIAVLAEPIPPLLDALEAEWWTRAAEFLGLTLVFWACLSAVGLMRARIGVGPGGVTAERLADLDAERIEKLGEVEQATIQLAAKVQRLEAIVEVLATQIATASPLDGGPASAADPSAPLLGDGTPETAP